MLHRLSAVCVLLLTLSGCSYFQSSDPADCDVQSSPDSMACAAKEVALYNTCVKANLQDKLARCDEATTFYKNRLAERLINELDSWFISERQVLLITDEAFVDDLPQVIEVVKRDHLLALRDAVLKTKRCQPELDLLASDLDAVTSFNEAMERGYGKPIYRYFEVYCNNRDAVVKDTNARALALLDQAIKDAVTYEDGQRVLNEIGLWINHERGLSYDMLSQVRERQAIVVLMMVRSLKETDSE